MQPMAQGLRVDHQQLQQLSGHLAVGYGAGAENTVPPGVWSDHPDTWVIDDTGFIKDGPASPGVARQYSGTLGKVGNCQIAVSVHAATDAASAPLDWRLFLPESWDDQSTTDPDAVAAITARRRRSAIPDRDRHRTKWEMAIEMIDDLTEWGRTPPVTVTHRRPAGADRTRHRLRRRRQGRDQRPSRRRGPGAQLYSGRGRPPTPATTRTRPARTSSSRPDAESCGPSPGGAVAGPTPGPPPRCVRGSPRCGSARANRDIPRANDGTLPEVWLLAEWPTGADEPTDYWLSTLPADTPLAEPVRLAKICWRIEHDYRDGLLLADRHPRGRSTARNDVGGMGDVTSLAS
ncbi:transposase [Rhodococcus jostii]|uniref:IS701 family transposase n=1 Tax=Rhodococcus jostii TaxID=132919 RepID=UPI00362F169A